MGEGEYALIHTGFSGPAGPGAGMVVRVFDWCFSQRTNRPPATFAFSSAAHRAAVDRMIESAEKWDELRVDYLVDWPLQLVRKSFSPPDRRLLFLARISGYHSRCNDSLQQVVWPFVGH